MELYVCNSEFEQIDVLDTFVSNVWTERYSAAGDFKLVAPASYKNKTLLKEFNWLKIDSSDEIMQIETVNTLNGQITAAGKSLLYFLMERAFRSAWADTTQGWVITTTEIYKIVNAVLRMAVNPATSMQTGQVLTPTQGANQVITDFYISEEIPAGVNERVSVTVPFAEVYNVLKTLVDSDDLGMKLTPHPTIQRGMLFKTYRGLDRTSTQSENPIVILDPNLGNFTDTETLRSISGYKNTAYVWPSGITSQSQIVMVSIDGASTRSRFDVRSMFVTASNIRAADYDAETLRTMLFYEGINALINNNYVKMVDGQVTSQNGYTFGRDYNLGDILELRSVDGDIASSARVTEYIRSKDSNGESAYPTLSVIG